MYFDAANAYDLSLLETTAQSVAPDTLNRVAMEAQGDIVERYTLPLRLRPVGSAYGLVYDLDDDRRRAVFLEGYNPDVTEAAGYNADRSLWTGFAYALRRAIVAVVNHRVRYGGAAGGPAVNPALQSETRGKQSWTLKSGSRIDPAWPVGAVWKAALDPYDLRTPTYTV